MKYLFFLLISKLIKSLIHYPPFSAETISPLIQFLDTFSMTLNNIKNRSPEDDVCSRLFHSKLLDCSNFPEISGFLDEDLQNIFYPQIKLQGQLKGGYSYNYETGRLEADISYYFNQDMIDQNFMFNELYLNYTRSESKTFVQVYLDYTIDQKRVARKAWDSENGLYSEIFESYSKEIKIGASTYLFRVKSCSRPVCDSGPELYASFAGTLSSFLHSLNMFPIPTSLAVPVTLDINYDLLNQSLDVKGWANPRLDLFGMYLQQFDFKGSGKLDDFRWRITATTNLNGIVAVIDGDRQGIKVQIQFSLTQI